MSIFNVPVIWFLSDTDVSDMLSNALPAVSSRPVPSFLIAAIACLSGDNTLGSTTNPSNAAAAAITAIIATTIGHFFFFFLGCGCIGGAS